MGKKKVKLGRANTGGWKKWYGEGSSNCGGEWNGMGVVRSRRKMEKGGRMVAAMREGNVFVDFRRFSAKANTEENLEPTGESDD